MDPSRIRIRPRVLSLIRKLQFVIIRFETVQKALKEDDEKRCVFVHFKYVTLSRKTNSVSLFTSILFVARVPYQVVRSPLTHYIILIFFVLSDKIRNLIFQCSYNV